MTSVRLALVSGCAAAACQPNVPPSRDGGDDGGPDAFVTCHHQPANLVVSTLAGCEQAGTSDGARLEARFDNPTNVALGSDGAVYVTDFDSGRLRKITVDGTTSTVVVRPEFVHPFGLAFADATTLYVETDDDDMGGHTNQTGTVWRVDVTTGDATVIARDLGRPRGLAVLSDGRIAMSDHMHHVVSLLDPTTGIATPLAGSLDVAGATNGSGAAALFAQPYDIVQLANGDLAVADLDNHKIRRITLTGEVTDLAGSGAQGTIDGPAAVAAFDSPQALAVRGNELYITDIHRFVVRRLASGVVTTIAGDGTAGWIDSDSSREARFYGVEGITAAAGDPRLIVADGNGGDGNPFHRIRVIDLGRL